MAQHLVVSASGLGAAVSGCRTSGAGDGWLQHRGLAGVSRRPVWCRRSANRGAGDRERVCECCTTRCQSRVSFRPHHPGHEPVPVDQLVAATATRFAPNTLIAMTAAAVDTRPGDLGVADRWADIAVAMLSLSWTTPSWRASCSTPTEYEAEPGVSRRPACTPAHLVPLSLAGRLST